MVDLSQLKPSPEKLKEIKLFAAFSLEELQRLINSGEAMIFEPHTNVVIEGELSWGLYLVINGVVGIYKTNKASGDVYDIGQLKSGQYFGEMSLIDESPRSATIRTLTETHTFFIGREGFQSVLTSSNDTKLRFYEHCVRDLVVRLREVNDSYVTSQFQLWKTMLSSKEVA